MRPPERSEREEADGNIEVPPKNTLNIKFLLKYPRMLNYKPRDPLVITSYMYQKQIDRVLIDNGSSTNILYQHFFR